MSKKQVPEVRFRGFCGEWEKNLFGNCVLIQRGGSPRPIESFMTNDENGINWIKIGDVSIGSRYITKTAEKIITEGEKYSQKVYRGDLILSNSMSVGRPYIMDIDGCIHDGRLLIRDEQKKFDLEYLQQMLSSTHMLIQYKSLASGGVVNNLNSELVQSTTICYPKIDEQTKIGDFFKNLDNFIIQNQNKYDKLVNMKKAFWDKMFPKDGADTPEVRFKGFDEKWTICKLGEICEEFQSGTSISANNIKEQEKYPVFGGNGLRGYTDTYNHNGIYALIGRQGALCGNVNLSFGKSYFTEHAIAVRAKKDFSTIFLYYVLGTMNLGQYSGQSAQPGLAVSKLIDLTNYIPIENEQTKIGTFFQTLDNLITLQKTKQEKLKNIKKACLDKMFI